VSPQRVLNPVLIRLFAIALSAVALTAASASANPRIKDIADVEGVRDNQLVGYGLVVGLDGTGDTLRNAAFTRQALNSMLERFDINVREADLRTGNVAAVIVTAELAPFSMQGTRMDVTISALGRCGQPARRRLDRHPADGGQWRCLRRRSGLYRRRRLCCGRRCGQRHPRRADQWPDRQWRGD
jgi:hypothetical protein